MSAYSDSVLSDTPSLYWRLGDAGSPVADTSGNGRTGAVSGATSGAADALTGDADAAFSFDGVDDRIVSTYAAFTGQRTFEGWANRTDTASADTLFGGDGAAPTLLRMENASDTFLFMPWTSGASTTWTSTGAGTGAYFHWALTYDNTSFEAELFINGVSKTLKTLASGYNTPGNFQIGRWGGVNNDPFKGLQDEVAVYQSILSAARIAAHYDIGINGSPVAAPSLFVTQSGLRLA